MIEPGIVISAGGAVLALLTFVVMSHRYQGDRLETAKEQVRGELRAEVARLAAALTRLERDCVRREEMGAMEQRTAAVLEKVTAKLDALSERLVSLAVLERQAAALEAKLDRVLDGRVGAD